MTRPKLQPKESDIQASIVAALRLLGWQVRRANCVSTSIDSRYIRANHEPGFGSVGIADLMAVKDGRVVFIEVKLPGATETPAQMRYQKWCELHGNKCVTCRSAEDALKAVGE